MIIFDDDDDDNRKQNIIEGFFGYPSLTNKQTQTNLLHLLCFFMHRNYVLVDVFDLQKKQQQRYNHHYHSQQEESRILFSLLFVCLGRYSFRNTYSNVLKNFLLFSGWSRIIFCCCCCYCCYYRCFNDIFIVYLSLSLSLIR